MNGYNIAIVICLGALCLSFLVGLILAIKNDLDI